MYNRRYDKVFVMLRQEMGGYSLGQRPLWGSCTMEIKNGSGRLTVSVQGLKAPRKDTAYMLYVIAGKGGKPVGIACDTLEPNAQGRAELRWNFDPDSVANSPYTVEDLHTVALLLKGREDYGLVVPMVGFFGEKANWKGFEEWRPPVVTAWEETASLLAAERNIEPLAEQAEESVSEAVAEEEEQVEQVEQAEVILEEMTQEGRVAVQAGAEEADAGHMPKMEPEKKNANIQNTNTQQANTQNVRIQNEPTKLSARTLPGWQRAAQRPLAKKISPLTASEEPIYVNLPPVAELSQKQRQHIQPEENAAQKASKRVAGYYEKARASQAKIRSREAVPAETQKAGTTNNFQKAFQNMLASFQKELEELEAGGVLTPEDAERIAAAGEPLREKARKTAAKQSGIPKKPEGITSPQKAAYTDKLKKSLGKQVDFIFENNLGIAPFIDDTREWKCISMEELAALPFDFVSMMHHWLMVFSYRKYKHLILGRDARGQIYLGMPDVYTQETKEAAEELCFQLFSPCAGEEGKEAAHGYWLRRIC